MHKHTQRATGIAAIAITLSLIVAGCAASPEDVPSGDVELTYRAADGTCTTEVPTAADEFLEPFLAGPDGLLATEKLAEPLDPETTVAFLNNGTVIGGLLQSFLQSATVAAGVKFQNVDTGLDADSINSAMNSVVESAPDIVISAALDATFFQDQLKQLEDAGTVVVYIGAVNASDFGLQDSVGGKGASEVNGQILAASSLYFTCGTGTEFVFYNVPQLAFSQVQLDSATAWLAENCPECTLRTVDISIADPSPADTIVSDLQANPETQFFITPADQFQIGLAQKAQLAGITNALGVGQSSIAPNIAQVAAGEQAAAFAVDYNMYMWIALDEGFRRLQGEDVTYDDWYSVVRSMSRVLTQESAQDYPTEAGFVADLDMTADFTALWK